MTAHDQLLVAEGQILRRWRYVGYRDPLPGSRTVVGRALLRDGRLVERQAAPGQPEGLWRVVPVDHGQRDETVDLMDRSTQWKGEGPMTETAASHGTIEDMTVEYPKPPYQGTRLRPVRVDDELWGNARTIAEKRGDNLSEIIREALRRYVRRNEELLLEPDDETAD